MNKTILIFTLLILISCNSQEIESLNTHNEGLQKELSNLRLDLNNLEDSISFYKQSLQACPQVTDSEIIRLIVQRFYNEVFAYNLSPTIEKNDQGVFALDVDDFKAKLDKLGFLSQSLMEDQIKKCQPCSKALKRVQLTEMDIYDEPTPCSFIQHANFWSKSQELADFVYIKSIDIKGRSGKVEIRMFQGSERDYSDIGALNVKLIKASGQWKVNRYEL